MAPPEDDRSERRLRALRRGEQGLPVVRVDGQSKDLEASQAEGRPVFATVDRAFDARTIAVKQLGVNGVELQCADRGAVSEGLPSPTSIVRSQQNRKAPLPVRTCDGDRRLRIRRVDREAGDDGIEPPALPEVPGGCSVGRLIEVALVGQRVERLSRGRRPFKGDDRSHREP
jgi:hypothetical protein